MEFDLPRDNSSIIKVIGVGGGGSNAVNHMYKQGIVGVDFIVCNTDKQSLDISPVPYKIQLGPSLTEGRGAGAIPEIGKNAAVENIDEIRDLLSNNTKMVFVTAGMGGGTGTGAAPVISQVAKEMGILTVGIVTVPFNFEGRKRKQQAEEGLEAMRKNVDTLLVINNERLREITGNLTVSNAFSQADDVLSVAAKGIAEVISVTGAINVDFNDVNTVMKDSGVAIMGSATTEGEDRAIKAVTEALSSPLLNDNDIHGANYVLLNITYGDIEVTMDEITDITDYIQDEAGSSADVIWGHGYDPTLGDRLCVTLIATGFQSSPITGYEKSPERKVRVLEDEVKPAAPVAEAKAPESTPFAGAREITAIQDEPFIKPSARVEEIKPETLFTEPVQQQPVYQQPVAQPEQGLFTTEWDAPEVKPMEAVVEPVQVVQHVQPTPAPQPVQEVVAEPVSTKRIFTLDDEVEALAEVPVTEARPTQQAPVSQHTMSPEESQRRNNERLAKIHEYTLRLKKADGVAQFENEPAYKRRNIQLDLNGDYSSDQGASRYNVSVDNSGETRLRGGNSFLHDNVD